MEFNMKTRSEIEEYLSNLGIKIQSEMEQQISTEYGEEVIRTERINSITGEKIIEDNLKYSQIQVLNKEAENALLDLISQSITSGDMETAKVALDVLQDTSTFYKGHQNAAIKNNIPLDKRIQFGMYCETKAESKEFSGNLAGIMASAHNIATTRRTEQVNNMISEIKSAALEKENDREIE